MKILVTVLFAVSVLSLCAASYKIGYEIELDRSWQAYADQYERDHQEGK